MVQTTLGDCETAATVTHSVTHSARESRSGVALPRSIPRRAGAQPRLVPGGSSRPLTAAPAALVLVASRSAGPDHAEAILRADLDGALDAAKRHARTVFASLLARFDGKCAVAVEIQADGIPIYVLASEGGAL